MHQYPQKDFPPFMKGPLFLLSMPIVQKLALDCPYHCVGIDPLKYRKREIKNCFWDLDDVFIGSCIKSTQKSLTSVSQLQIVEKNFLESFMSQQIPSDSKNDKELVLHKSTPGDIKVMYYYKTHPGEYYGQG